MIQQDRSAAEDTTAQPTLWRRTTIQLGPLRITREHHVVPQPDGGSPVARQRSGWRLAALAAMLGTVGAGGLAVAATKSVSRPAYSISVPVPERHVATRAAATPASSKAVRGKQAAPTAKAPDPSDTDDQRAMAIAAAFATGDVQEWQSADGREHGFVVAGAAEDRDGTTCRSLSILIRPLAGGDRVDQVRQCRAGQGG